MPKQHVHTISYGGPAPLAIILWYKHGEEDWSYHTLCYDEEALINMHNRHTTPGDIYSTLRPSIQMVGEPLPYEGATACKQVS